MTPQAFTEQRNKVIISPLQRNNQSFNQIYFLSFSAIYGIFTMLGVLDFFTRMWGNSYLATIIGVVFVMLLAFYLYETKGRGK